MIYLLHSIPSLICGPLLGATDRLQGKLTKVHQKLSCSQVLGDVCDQLSLCSESFKKRFGHKSI